MESHTAMAAEVAPGRLFFGRLRQTADLLESVEAFCFRKRIRAALFSATGTVLSATFGVFDPSQQVYAVRVEHRPLEIVSCRGSVLPGDDRPRAVAHIVFGDGQAALCGGRLFSETRVDAVEFDVRELVGPLPSRRYDPLTGRMRLRLP
jgi:predicted DNA-binding protein with PD1-like motif